MRDIANMSIWKNKNESDDENSGLRAVLIDELDLTNRPVNCLKRVGCRTVGDLLTLMDSENGLKSVRNLGSKSEAEITKKIQSFMDNYKERASLAPAGQASSAKKYSWILMKPLGKLWYSRLEEYDIPKESISRLHSCGVFYVADLYKQDFETEPEWKDVRELFALIVARAKKDGAAAFAQH